MEKAQASVEKSWNDDVNVMMSGLLQKVLLFLTPEQNNIILIGHGVGGVYAVLALLALKKIFASQHGWFEEVKISAVTFGEPRFGAINFARYLAQTESKIFRVTHANDYVLWILTAHGLISICMSVLPMEIIRIAVLVR
ncbi:hypothetical protein G9A89_002574 [Geosiphon pyriformis]|nr:hypothetical protein G9A89_002574 [Geosiphon pyriformis]